MTHNFLPSTNGLSKIYEKEVCLYRGMIDLRLTDRFSVLSTLKEWMDMNIHGNVGNVCIDATTLYHRENGFTEALTIYGHYDYELSNENEIYETIYSLFQFLCIKCKQNELLFYLYNSDQKYKEYKIVTKK